MGLKEKFLDLESTSYLYMVQEELDYWIVEGGNIQMLERQIDLRIDLHVEGVGMWKHLPVKAMDHVRYLEMFLNGLSELKSIKGEI